MSGKKYFKLWLIFILLTSVLILSAQQIKVIVTVDDSSIKETPEISGSTLAKVPMNTILSVVEKQGEWYKITKDNEGEPITGYIHEMLVKEISDEEIAQIKTGIVFLQTAQPVPDFARRCHDFKAKDQIARIPVRQDGNTARIRRYVAANHAGAL